MKVSRSCFLVYLAFSAPVALSLVPLQAQINNRFWPSPTLLQYSEYTAMLENGPALQESVVSNDVLADAYNEWRQKYNKEPTFEGFEIFKANYLALMEANEKDAAEARAQGFPRPSPLELNEYGDCSFDAYMSPSAPEAKQNESYFDHQSTRADEEQQARQKVQEEERIAAEQARFREEAEARRKAAEEEEARRMAAQQEQQRVAAEQTRLQAEAEARHQAEMEAARRREEEAVRAAAEQARLQAETEARRKAEEEARLQAEAKLKAGQEERESYATKKKQTTWMLKAVKQAKRAAETKKAQKYVEAHRWHVAAEKAQYREVSQPKHALTAAAQVKELIAKEEARQIEMEKRNKTTAFRLKKILEEEAARQLLEEERRREIFSQLHGILEKEARIQATGVDEVIRHRQEAQRYKFAAKKLSSENH